MSEKVLVILVLLGVCMVFSKNASFDLSSCLPNTVKLLRVANFTTNSLRLFYFDESPTRFRIAKCKLSGEDIDHESDYWEYGPNYVDFTFENLSHTPYTLYTLYVRFEDIDRANCTYENVIKFKSNSTSRIDITPLICEDGRFYNISWNQYGVDESEPVEIAYNEAVRLPRHQILNRSGGNTFVILPERLPFSGYQCNISAVNWINVTSKELVVTNGLPDFIANRCDCNLNAISWDEIKCFFGDYLRMGYNVDDSSSEYQIDSITIENVDNQWTDRSVYYKFVPGFVDVCLKDLNSSDVYSLRLTYFDVDRIYCTYDGALRFKSEDLSHCKNWNLKGVKRVRDTNYYEVFYTSNELFVDYKQRIKVLCIETATNKIVSETKFHNVTRKNKEVSSFGVYLENLEIDTNYTLRVAVNGNNYSCFEDLVTFTVPPPPPEISKSQDFDLLAVLILMTLILLGCLAYILWKTCRRNFLKLRHFFISRILARRGTTRHEVNSLYIPLERTDPYEIPRENIEKITPIGGGEFGTVYYAKVHRLFGTTGYRIVAIKQLRENASMEEVKDFQDEINIWKKIGSHDHIVRMLACVTESEPYTIVMELIFSGDLRRYLLSLRTMWYEKTGKSRFLKGASDCVYIKPYSGTVIRPHARNTYVRRTSDTNSIDSALPESPRTPLTEAPEFNIDIKSVIPKEMMTQPQGVLDSKELENFARQIASGMACLEGMGIVHRDLAARNILITNTKTLKITDFGMSKEGPYVNQSSKRVPIRWMAIESIEQFKTSHKSDVWSFGVVLWEIGTLGAFPYDKLQNTFILPFLKGGSRLQRPEICTDGLYDVMLKCWLEDPDQRPSFSDLEIMLNAKRHHTYVEFSQLRPTYEFPPAVDDSTS